MKVGDLVMIRSSRTVWLTLDIIYDTILVLNQKTRQRAWMTKGAFEVISASR